MKESTIAYVVLAELVFLLFSLFSSQGSILFLASALLVFVNALFILGLLVMKRPWSKKGWFGVFVVFMLMLLLYDRFLVDVFKKEVEVLHVVLLVVLFALYFERNVKIPRKVSFARLQAAPVGDGAGDFQRTVFVDPYLEVPQKITRNYRRRTSGAKARKRFIAEHFGSGLMQPILDSPSLVKETFPVQEQRESPAQADIEEAQEVPDFAEVVPEPVFQDSFNEEVLPEQSSLLGQAVEHMDLVASTNGKKFHVRSCMVAKRIPKEKQLPYTDPVACLKDGFVPCGVCNPLKRNP